jgi:CDP-diacylglycerol--glycerol-3-phosphate 3-phosphatidyltransferase
MPAGRGGKLKTMLQTLSLGSLTLPLWVWPFGGVLTTVAYVLLGAALVMTVLSGVDYVFKAARLRETSERTRLRRAARAAEREARAAHRAHWGPPPSADTTRGADGPPGSSTAPAPVPPEKTPNRD